MRRLVVAAAIALSVGCATASAPGSALSDAGMHPRVFCNLDYPWQDGPLTKVPIRECFGWYHETPTDLPGDIASYSWWVDKLRYEENDHVAVVTIGMRQSIGGKKTVVRRTYHFRWDGRAPALVKADPSVTAEEP